MRILWKPNEEEMLTKMVQARLEHIVDALVEV